MGSWYAHKFATTFSMSVLPARWDVTPYNERGWTTFERAVSQLIKASASLGWRPLADPAVVRKVGGVAGSYRAAPEPPKAFAARLARKVFTNGKADCELVAGLYADTLAAAMGGTKYLWYTNCGWGDEEVEQLAAALRWARAAVEVDVTGNPRIGQRGLDALAAAIAGGAAPKLKQVFCDLARSARAASALRSACEARGIELSIADV